MIVRAKHDKEHPYFPALRNPFQNKQLSWAARGLLAFLLSQPETWEPRTDHLIEQGDLKKDGMQGLLRELENAGHLTRQRQHDDKGKLVWTATVYENPADNPERENPAMVEPQPDSPALAEPLLVQPALAKPALQIIKNKENIELRENRVSECVCECEPSQGMPAHTHAPAKPAWANPYDSPAVQCFEQVLGVRPVILYAEQIAAEVTDLTQWKDTLEFWRRKNYRKSSVDKMLHNYREHATQAAAVIELPPAPKPQPTDAEILALMRQMAASNDIGDIQTLKSQAAQIAERGGPQIEWEYFVCEHVQLGARRGLRAVK